MDEPVEAIMQPTYFVPETMTIWTCFQVSCGWVGIQINILYYIVCVSRLMSRVCV